MSTRSWLRLGAICGILSVVLEFGGFGLRASNSPIGLTIFPPKDQLASAIAQPTNTAAWVGFYLLALSTFIQFVFMLRLSPMTFLLGFIPGYVKASRLEAELRQMREASRTASHRTCDHHHELRQVDLAVDDQLFRAFHPESLRAVRGLTLQLIDDCFLELLFKHRGFLFEPPRLSHWPAVE